MSAPNTIKIDEIEYVRKDSVSVAPSGNRVVLVADRGWIFAGDLSEEDGRIRLDNAVNIRSWRSVGIEGVIADATKAVIKRIPGRVDMPAEAELFRIPVPVGWGL